MGARLFTRRDHEVSEGGILGQRRLAPQRVAFAPAPVTTSCGRPRPSMPAGALKSSVTLARISNLVKFSRNIFVRLWGEAGAALLMCNVRFEMYSTLVTFLRSRLLRFCLVLQATRFFQENVQINLRLEKIFLLTIPSTISLNGALRTNQSPRARW